MVKSKMVITGGGGFCGTHLADHFIDRYQITLFDNFERNALRFAPHLKRNADINVISGDVLDRIRYAQHCRMPVPLFTWRLSPECRTTTSVRSPRFR